MKYTYLFILFFFYQNILSAQPEKALDQVSKQGQKGAKSWFKKQLKGGKVSIYDRQIKANKEIIGTEPSWMLSSELKPYEHHLYNLLTTLVLGEYDVNPVTGNARFEKAKNAVLNTDVLGIARVANDRLKILYHVVNYGDFGAGLREKNDFFTKFLTDEEVQTTMCDSVNAVISRMAADGVVLDFQNVPASEESVKAFIDFVKLVRKKGNAKIGSYEVYLKFPYNINKQKLLDKNAINALSATVDKYIIKVYGDEFVRRDTICPAGATLSGNTYFTLDKVLKEYLALGIPKEKIIFEFAYYALQWQKLGDEAYQLHTAKPQVPYYMMKGVKEGKNFRYAADTSFAVYSDEKANQHIVLDNKKTLSKKYSWLESSGLSGASIYGMGYNPSKDLQVWEAIDRHYGESPMGLFYPILSFLLFSLFGSFIWAIIHYWQVRNFLHRERTYYYYWLGGLTVCLIAFLWASGIIPRFDYKIAGGLAILFLAFPFVAGYFRKAKQWMPR